jgi:hypothetical protein
MRRACHWRWRRGLAESAPKQSLGVSLQLFEPAAYGRRQEAILNFDENNEATGLAIGLLLRIPCVICHP